MAIVKRETKNGQVRYRAQVYVRGKGKYATGKWHDKKAKAVREETILKNEVQTGLYREESNKTLNEAVNYWLEYVAPYDLKPKTIKNHRRSFELHYQSVMGNRPLKSIRTYEVQQLIKKKHEFEGFSASTIQSHVGFLSKVFETFVDYGELRENPISKVKRPKRKENTGQVWSHEELKKFLSEAMNYQEYWAFWMASFAGVRMGVACAFEWDKHINFEKNLILVRQMYSADEEKIVDRVKVDSKRDIVMSDNQMKQLLEHKNTQNPKSKYVCSKEDGSYFRDFEIRSRMYSIIEKLGLKKIPFKNLRSSHATLLIQSDVNIKVVQQRLGHKSITTTLKHYIHTNEAQHKASAESLDGLIITKSLSRDEKT